MRLHRLIAVVVVALLAAGAGRASDEAVIAPVYAENFDDSAADRFKSIFRGGLIAVDQKCKTEYTAMPGNGTGSVLYDRVFAADVKVQVDVSAGCGPSKPQGCPEDVYWGRNSLGVILRAQEDGRRYQVEYSMSRNTVYVTYFSTPYTQSPKYLVNEVPTKLPFSMKRTLTGRIEGKTITVIIDDKEIASVDLTNVPPPNLDHTPIMNGGKTGLSYWDVACCAHTFDNFTIFGEPEDPLLPEDAE